ncbi:non-ribosomal peptide synthetase [Streptomyces sp. NPDC052101]|uniref:non-ribosomal peptide synthetase n=1 Tax=Streptomyces sp. NPDC052101 TaxID=3155763 RepID=UPI003428DACB
MFNATPAPLLSPHGRSTVPERIAAHAARRPDAVAVTDGAATLSYARLHARTRELAGRLCAAGVRSGDVVAVLLERSVDAVAACSAVMSAGAGYLMLDPGQPAPRTRYLLGDSTARAVVSRPELLSRVDPERLPGMAYLDCGESDRAEGAGPAPAAAGGPEPDGPAYLNYTSGSTGRPKGVLIGHPGLANLVDWYRHRYQVEPGDRVSQLVRPTFDAFALETWTCLAAGASLHIAPDGVRQDPERLRDWLCRSGITVSFVPTPLAEHLFTLDWPGPDEGCALRELLVGGDRLTRRPPAGLPFRVHNNYGPTECTVVATCSLVDERYEPAGDVPPPIGRPLPGVTAYVLDAQLTPVTQGAPGVLHVGGVGVALGYLHAPGDDDGPFRTDPFRALPGARMYATGDLVRQDEAGQLHYLGRLDEQVQIRGVRVEPAEAEAVLRRHPEVDRAVVVGTDEAEPRLAGYVTARGGAPDPRQIRAFVAERLPDHLVPATITVVPELPLTPEGKVDRRALARREPECADGSGGRPAAGPPRTGDDSGVRALVALWQDVLGVPCVAAEDDFFEIGGDSLRVIRLVARARRQGIALRPDDVYAHPVLADLAASVEAARTAAEAIAS